MGYVSEYAYTEAVVAFLNNDQLSDEEKELLQRLSAHITTHADAGWHEYDAAIEPDEEEVEPDDFEPYMEDDEESYD